MTSKTKTMHKSKKATKPPFKLSTAKKKMRRQLFEVLEQEAMNYVGALGSIVSSTTKYLLIQN